MRSPLKRYQVVEGELVLPEVIIDALRAAARGSRKAVDVLVDELDSQDADIRVACARALVDLTLKHRQAGMMAAAHADVGLTLQDEIKILREVLAEKENEAARVH